MAKEKHITENDEPNEASPLKPRTRISKIWSWRKEYMREKILNQMY